MKKIFKISLTILTIWILANSQMKATDNALDTILAKVNGKNITLAHIITAVSVLPPEYNNLDNDYLLNGLLDQIIKEEIMSQSLPENRLTINIQLENEVRSLRAKYALESQIGDFPSEQEIRSAYEKVRSSHNSGEEFNASHILVETEQKAKELVSLLSAGADFSTLAKKESIGPSGSNGGNLGWFGLGQMVPEFEAAVIVLEPGKISQPVQTQFGWHVIALNDRRIQSLPSLEKLRPEIIQNLKQSRIEEIVELALQNAEIKRLNEKIDPALIRSIGLLKK